MSGVRFTVWLKVLVMVFAGWATASQAAVIGTAEHFGSARSETAQLRDSVQERLISLGVTNEDALARVAALSQAELQLLADRMDELPAGGIIGVLGVLFVVLLVLEIVGVTDIFTAV